MEKKSHPTRSVYLSNNPVSSSTVQKHFGMVLDNNLSYEHQLSFVLNKEKKKIGVFCKSQQSLSRLIVGAYFDHGDIDYGRAFNESFHEKY